MIACVFELKSLLIGWISFAANFIAVSEISQKLVISWEKSSHQSFVRWVGQFL